MKKIPIEKIDDITNTLMDYLRTEMRIKEDSDRDDEVYTIIHNAIREWYLTIKP